MRKGLTGNVKHSNGLLTSHKQRGERALLQRRRAKPGYPKEIKFTTPEDVYSYLNNDRLICLLCGKAYKMLGGHLLIHGFTVESYREKYGLPYSKGLVGTELRKDKSDRMKKMLRDGTIEITLEDREHYRKMAHNATKKFQPYRKAISIRNGNKELAKRTNTPAHLIHQSIWQDKDYWNALNIMKEQNRAPRDVLYDKSLLVPRYAVFMNKVRKDSEFREAYFNVIDNLPFDVLAAHQILGKKIRTEITKLKSEGFTHNEIKDKCNVSLQSVNNIVKELGLKVVQKTHCKRGHKYPDGQSNCKICNTETTRILKGHLPREVSKITIVNVSCSNCGVEVTTNRYGASRPIIYCESCKRIFYLESQRRYKEANLGRRNEMAKIAYQKRKGNRK